MEISGNTARGHDRGSNHAYTAEVSERVVQLYDHGLRGWFAYDIQVIEGTDAA